MSALRLAPLARQPARPYAGNLPGPYRMIPEQHIAGVARPFTGAEYIESLKDGREVYINGEWVRNVTMHPAFRNAARSLARLYDTLHDPAKKDMLTYHREDRCLGPHFSCRPRRAISPTRRSTRC